MTYQSFVDGAMGVLNGSMRSLMENDESVAVLQAEEERLRALFRNVMRMTPVYPQLQELEEILQKVITDITQQLRTLDNPIGFQAPQTRSTGGRPMFIITREQLAYMVEEGFSTAEMAKLLHVSRSVVKRRLRHFEIRIRSRYSTITDDDLDSKVKRLTDDNQFLGKRLVQGMLAAEGVHVQRQRVADSLIRVNEAGVAMRWCRAIHRRVYKVSGPNALWHIDGNHKLIRWGFVIHGGIDGYSRLVVFLRASTNNRSETMTAAFMRGTSTYGVPSRVRSDHGLENVGVAAFMIGYRGPRRGSIITGRSVHNQRIERLWRDLFQSCTGDFHRLFLHMEETGQLDISDEAQLWTLHYVYQPRIQRAMDQFRDAWNNHRLRTESGRSPRQLFLRGIIEQIGQGNRGIDDLFYEPPSEPLQEVEDEYGVDVEAPVPESEGVIPELSNVPCPLTEQQYRQLSQEIDPLEGTGLGLDVYTRTLAFLQQLS